MLAVRWSRCSTTRAPRESSPSGWVRSKVRTKALRKFWSPSPQMASHSHRAVAWGRWVRASSREGMGAADGPSFGAEAPMVRVTVPFELMRIELWCRQSGRRTRMAKLWRRPVAMTSCTPREWAAWREARLRALTRPSSPSKVPSRSIAIRRIALLRAAAVKLPPGLSILGDRIVVVTYGTHRVGLSCYSGWTRWN